MRGVHYGFRGSQGNFCRYDSCIITDQLATGAAALERELLLQNLVIWHERMGKSADEICAEYGLTLAEVYAALAFYYNHRAEIDRNIDEQEAFVAQQRQCTTSALAQKLKAQRVE